MTVENLGIVDLMLNHYLSSFLVIKTTRFSAFNQQLTQNRDI